MTQRQTRQHSGSQYHLNLDSETFAVLSQCRQLHLDHGNNFSNSVIVRRAIRAYRGTLALAADDTGWNTKGECVISGAGMRQEIIETQRAAKGVL